MAMPICFMLLTHWARRAASRAAWTAGSNRAIRTAMMAITTRSSIRVNPRPARVMGKLLLVETRAEGGDGTGTIVADRSDESARDDFRNGIGSDRAGTPAPARVSLGFQIELEAVATSFLDVGGERRSG